MQFIVYKAVLNKVDQEKNKIVAFSIQKDIQDTLKHEKSTVLNSTYNSMYTVLSSVLKW